MAKRRTILSLVLFVSSAIFAAQAPQPSGSPAPKDDVPVVDKAVHGLKFNWARVFYHKWLRNPKVLPEQRNSLLAESLSISCEFKMEDPRLLLGIAPEPTIEKITSARGNDIEVDHRQSGSRRMYHRDIFLRRWLGEIDLARRVERWKRHPERHPPPMKLDPKLRELPGGRIGLLKGHYIGLMAESIYHVDLPFKTCDEWVPLTDNVDVRVIQARNVPGKYHWKAELRPDDTQSSLYMWIGDPLPSRLIVSPVTIMRNGSGFSAGGAGHSSGLLSGSGLGRAEGIRIVMAVNPVHAKVPFEIRNIPLSAPVQATPPQTRGPNRLTRLPNGRLTASTKTAMRYAADKARSLTRPVPILEEGEFFDVDWHSIGYSLDLCNPEISNPGSSLELAVSCEARILKPEMVLGTCDKPIIERITDGSGRDIDLSLTQPRPDRMLYSTPAYRMSRSLTPPSALAKLEGKARSALQLPLSDRHRPTRNMELEPVRLTIRLDHRLIGKDQKEIRRVDGYFHALLAESIKHVEVPFKRSRRWVRLTSDVSIQVDRAWRDGVQHRFTINERSKTQIDPGRLHVYCPLPDGIVVERNFTGPDVPPRREDHPRGSRRLPVPTGGRGFVSHRVDGVECKIDTIDYGIAVGPAHFRIPIRLENIPLPDFSPRPRGKGTEAQRG
ncbi:MAG: hypothetical protein ACYSWQ_12390 [Planctomycetota bacterium]|jgi:hypothetical protein